MLRVWLSVVINKALLETAIPIHLCTVYSGFCTIVSEMRVVAINIIRHHMPKVFAIWFFKKKFAVFCEKKMIALY